VELNLKLDKKCVTDRTCKLFNSLKVEAIDQKTF
jgi:hypothetical protein